jgi:ABC-type dipeptide/oligopeptide/nickel transport system ATPase component
MNDSNVSDRVIVPIPKKLPNGNSDSYAEAVTSYWNNFVHTPCNDTEPFDVFDKERTTLHSVNFGSFLRSRVGSIYEAVAFPKRLEEVANQKILDAIRFVELPHLLTRPEATWREGLSTGKRQRIAIARIFVHEPQFALLDEATNAIPLRVERKIYQKMRELGIATVSIAHRASLNEFHRFSLVLNGDESFTFTEH